MNLFFHPRSENNIANLNSWPAFPTSAAKRMLHAHCRRCIKKSSSILPEADFSFSYYKSLPAIVILNEKTGSQTSEHHHWSKKPRHRGYHFIYFQEVILFAYQSIF
jgi:hypothetical protein